MSVQKPVRVGFIGTGWTERVQIPMFRRGGLVAQAICSGNPANAQRVAQKLAIPTVYEEWRALIAAPEIEVVSIVTPPHLHAAMAIAALQAGKHVLCEKPMALNVAQAEAMLAAAQAAPNQLALIDHELRFHPQRVQLRRLLRQGYVGDLLAIQLDRLGSERLNPATPWSWHDDVEQGGGMVGALGSHLLDLARWLIGRIDALTAQLQISHPLRHDARGVPHTVTADDHAQLLLHFTNHTQGTLTVSGITPGGYGMSVTLIGTQGALRLDNKDQLWGAQGEELHQGKWQPLATTFPEAEIADLSGSSPFTIGSYYLAKRLAQALAAGETAIPEPASFYDGLVIQRALDAARRSYAEQRWVQL
jgi:predicted dehydrogenase